MCVCMARKFHWRHICRQTGEVSASTALRSRFARGPGQSASHMRAMHSSVAKILDHYRAVIVRDLKQQGGADFVTVEARPDMDGIETERAAFAAIAATAGQGEVPLLAAAIVLGFQTSGPTRT